MWFLGISHAILSDVVLLQYKNLSFVVQIIYYSFSCRWRYIICVLWGVLNVKMKEFNSLTSHWKSVFPFQRLEWRMSVNHRKKWWKTWLYIFLNRMFLSSSSYYRLNRRQTKIRKHTACYSMFTIIIDMKQKAHKCWLQIRDLC